MDSRFAVTLFAAVVVASLFVPVSATAAAAAPDEDVLTDGSGADALAYDRLRPAVASSGPARAGDGADGREGDAAGNGAAVPGKEGDADGVLQQSTRAAVYATVRESPGETLTGIADAVDVTRSTVRYHARLLREAGLVDATEAAGALRFAPADVDVELAAALNADGTATVLEAVAEREPASVTTLAAATDRAPSTVSHHLSALEERGLVERERVGESVVTMLAPATRTAVTTGGAAPADD